jgi:ubiquinone/menaquinone biosynthesis C-methylase UbiE
MIARVQNLNQFVTLWSDHKLKSIIIRFLKTRMIHDFKIKFNEQNEIIQKIEKLIMQKTPDDIIYGMLYDIFKKRNISFIGQSSGRSKSRINDILEILPRNLKINSYLDVGCSEGSITISLGRALNLEKHKIHGCDIKTIKSNEFMFTQIAENGHLPYKNKSFDLISCFMVLHHIYEPKQTLHEIYRILKNGGYLLIREHDCKTKNMFMVFDIIHGLYSLSFKKEDPDFCKTYFAEYFTKNALIKMVENTGFKLIKTSYYSNLQEAYYCLFKKIDSFTKIN